MTRQRKSYRENKTWEQRGEVMGGGERTEEREGMKGKKRCVDKVRERELVGELEM